MPSKPKLLLPSAGCKVALMRQLERDFEVYPAGFAEDMSSCCMAGGDRFVEQPEGLDDPGYMSWLLGTCARLKIDVILPVRDGDMVRLSNAENKLGSLGTKLILSPRGTIDVANDKLAMFKKFEGTRVRVPETRLLGERPTNLHMPVFVKPRAGSGSRGVSRVDSLGFLNFLRAKYTDNSHVAQDIVRGQEYTVDVFCDFGDTLELTSIRERTSVKDGQMHEGRVVSFPALQSFAFAITQVLKFVGPVNMQFIVDGDGIPWLIDINLRFGGGTPLTIAAGCDFVQGLRQLVDGKPVNMRAPRIGTRAISFIDYVFQEAK